MNRTHHNQVPESPLVNARLNPLPSEKASANSASPLEDPGSLLVTTLPSVPTVVTRIALESALDLELAAAGEVNKARSENPDGERLSKRILESYRREWPAIPASFVSSFLSLMVMRSALSVKGVDSTIQAMGSFLGGAACITLNYAAWYIIFNAAVEPIFKRALSNFIKRPELPTGSEEPQRLADEKSRSAKLFIGYSIAFTLAQLGAQVLMLHSGMEAKAAQTWNSGVANVLWLATLPIALYVCNSKAKQQIAAD